MPDEPSVPLTVMLSSIEGLLRETRAEVRSISDKLQSKADVAHLTAIEGRVTALERDSAADDAVTGAIKSMSVSRKAMWLSVGMTVANWLVSIFIWTFLK